MTGVECACARCEWERALLRDDDDADADADADVDGGGAGRGGGGAKAKARLAPYSRVYSCEVRPRRAPARGVARRRA